MRKRKVLKSFKVGRISRRKAREAIRSVQKRKQSGIAVYKYLDPDNYEFPWRRFKVFQRVLRGETYSEIGEGMGVSGGRVGQIFWRAFGDFRSLERKKERKYPEYRSPLSGINHELRVLRLHKDKLWAAFCEYRVG